MVNKHKFVVNVSKQLIQQSTNWQTLWDLLGETDLKQKHQQIEIFINKKLAIVLRLDVDDDNY